MKELGRFTAFIEDYNNLDSFGKLHAMRRHLFDMARKYNAAHDELERLKKTMGLDKPFPFLRLPRELRDQIYAYSLCAAEPVVSILELNRCFESRVEPYCPYRPPTPGLLRANKQIYHETVGMLYSKNVFKFWEPGELVRFAKQIGIENRTRVRQIWIPLEPFSHAQQDDGIPDCIAAMKAYRFEEIGHLILEGRITFNEMTLLLPSVSEETRDFVIDLLGRVADDKVPRLSLKHVQVEERDKFPKSWEIATDPSGSYKEQVEARRKELLLEEEMEDLYN